MSIRRIVATIAALMLLTCTPSSPADLRAWQQRFLELEAAGKYRELAQAAAEFTAAIRAESGERSLPFGYALKLSGSIKTVTGDLDGAESDYRKALLLYESLGKPSDPKQVAEALEIRLALASLLGVKQDLRAARKEYEALLPKLPPQSADAALASYQLGAILLQLGEVSEGRRLFENAAAIPTGNEPMLAGMRGIYGFLLVMDGKLGQAETLLKASLEMASGSPASRPFMIFPLTGLGMIARDRGDHEAAGKFANEAMTILEQHFDSQHFLLNLLLPELASVAEFTGDLDKAERLVRQALNIAEKAFGPGSVGLVGDLEKLAGIRWKQNDPEGARELLARARDIQKNALTDDSLNWAETLHLEAELASDRGDFDEALKLERRALELRRKQLGEEHRFVADSMENLAMILNRKQECSEAIELLDGAIGVYLKALPARHPDIVRSITHRGVLSRDCGHASEAQDYWRKALSQLPASPNFARPAEALLNGLIATVYMAQGNPVEAESHLKLTRELIAGHWMGTDKITAETALALGAALAARGEIMEAEHWLRTAHATFVRSGPHHPDTIRVATELARVLRARGDMANAKALLAKTLADFKESHENDVILEASVYAALAYTEFAGGNHAEAERLLLHAVDVEQRGPHISPDLPAHLYYLGLLRSFAGDLRQARTYWERAQEVASREFDKKHPIVAYVNEARARLLSSPSATASDRLQAVRLASLAEQLLEERVGADHPDTASAMGVVAKAKWAVGDLDGAYTALSGRAKADARNFARRLVLADEEQYGNLLEEFSPSDLYVSFHMDGRPNDPAAAKLAFWAVLQRKGTIQDIVAEHSRLEHTVGKTAAFNRWAQMERSARNCAFSRPLIDLPGSAVSGCDALALTVEAGRAYEELLKAVPTLANAAQPVELSALAQKLHEMGGYTLVEIVQYSSQAPAGGYDSRYAAYILFSDGRIDWTNLGYQSDVDQVLTQLRELQSNPESDAGKTRNAARALDRLIMEPIRSNLGGRTKLFVAADGELNLISFSSLVDEKSHELIDTYTIAALTSGRDLLRLGPTTESHSRGDYLFANPSYRAAAAPPANYAASSLGDTVTCQNAYLEHDWPAVLVGPSPDFAAKWQQALPGLEYFDKEKATKYRLASLESPRSVWLLTHGFFCSDTPKSGRNGETARSLWENPMERAAIVLTGGSAKEPAARRNGYMTATEFARLNWEGTELVVLGACQTALGDIRVGDGVHGLRRSLIVSGARSQVMTLWTVDAQETVNLLSDFAKRVGAGEERLEALRNAQKTMRRLHPHPYFWAGFHFMGDPRPMSR